MCTIYVVGRSTILGSWHNRAPDKRTGKDGYNQDSIFSLESRSMDKDTLAMARGNYGYGRWDAPYWFIGPEQGMGPHEKNLRRRVDAWLELGSHELNDCREFHHRISEMKWHFKEPVDLQSTWRPLMLLLMTFLDPERSTDNGSLREYQRDRWGSLKDETCVIELSGLAAPSLKESKGTGGFLQERIKIICERMLDHPPKLVVMYGREQKDSWNRIGRAIAGREFPPDDSAPGKLPKTNVLSHPPTILVWTPAPSRPIWDGTQYLGNEYWRRLGTELRNLGHSSMKVPVQQKQPGDKDVPTGGKMGKQPPSPAKLGNRPPKPKSSPSRLDTAIALAVRAHAGQKDKAGVDYILHPLRVMLAMKDDLDRIVAALHDVVEDCGITLDEIEDEFGRPVRDAVDAISHRDGESYPEYWRRITGNTIAVRVKVADSRDNLARVDALPEPERSQMAKKYRDTIKAISG